MLPPVVVPTVRVVMFALVAVTSVIEVVARTDSPATERLLTEEVARFVTPETLSVPPIVWLPVTVDDPTTRELITP